ncbi:hypothetical protein PHYPO_G00205220 [Pangasianodon hypophthalmus]|uniref:Immunoglobulin domain-containing protein n=1 Tax=Pangasianodon hypophthalmus TaxID=310915 RepID=A0A5N5PDE1_PANHP|nr:uncharacterized protein si:dkey-192g7.3 [Pangasianodon hypophthalmus]KAB5577023.1 hypothetical protein PHYPO_G00205220 [Pangasianodon hypophthalmus]
MSRFAIVVWFLAVSCMDSRAAEPIQYMSVSVGQNVILPCPCSKDTNKLVWQIGEEIVVNHCCEEEDPPHESYVNRTQVFLSFTKGNCSLLLRDVSLNDERIFTCYIFNGEESLDHMHEVGLKVEVFTAVDQGQTSSFNDPSTTKNDSEPHTGFSVGVPLSLILVILAGLIVALIIRKHQQRRPRMVVIQDPQAKLPIMIHTPV